MSIVDDIHFKRTLRTPSSERLLGLLSTNGMEHDAVAVDLHFLPSGVATGTVTVLDGGGSVRKTSLRCLNASTMTSSLASTSIRAG